MLDDTGVPHPDALKRPPPSEEDDVYYVGFCILGGRRLYSQVGPQPLPLTEILAYIDELDVTDVDEREEYLDILTDLDSAEMDHISKRVRKK